MDSKPPIPSEPDPGTPGESGDDDLSTSAASSEPSAAFAPAPGTTGTASDGGAAPVRPPATPEQRVRGVASMQLDGAADAVRRMGRRAHEQGGPLGRAEPLAHRVGDGLQSAAAYVRDHDVDSMRDDIEGSVRESPVRSLAIAVAAGFVLGRLIR